MIVVLNIRSKLHAYQNRVLIDRPRVSWKCFVHVRSDFCDLIRRIEGQLVVTVHLF